MRIANLNAYKLRLNDRGTAGWQDRVTAIRELNPDILGLQEVRVDEDNDPATWDDEAAEIVQLLAADCELTATALDTRGQPRTAMANNSHRGWYTAVMWNPESVRCLPGSFRPYGAPDFWHGVTTAAFDIGAIEPFTVAVYHGDPIRGGFRADESLRLKSIFRRTGGAKPGAIIGDFNGLSAANIAGPDGRLHYYDPEPYLDQDHDDLEYQLLPGTIGGEQLADRRGTETLLRKGYMVDAAAHLGVAWQPTVGHWTDGEGDPDLWGSRRIDLILVSRPVAPALIAYGTNRSAAASRAADHLPIYTDLDPDLVT